MSSTWGEQPSSVLKEVDSNVTSNFTPKSYMSVFSKEESFFSKKSAHLERQLAEQSKMFSEEKSELEMKILMMQEEMKELKNRLVDKDEELKHTKAWNESLIKTGEQNQSKLRNTVMDMEELESLREQNSVMC